MRINLAAVPQQALLNLIVQPIWDTIQIGISNTAPVPFFTNLANKSKVQTNMVQPGMIPSPDEFIARGFLLEPVQNGVFPQVVTDITDQQRLLEKGYFSFQVGTNARRIVEGSLKLFPAGIGLEGTVATGGSTAAGAGSGVALIIGNGVRRLDNRFALTDKFSEKLRSNEAFKGFIEYPDGTLTLSLTLSLRCIVPGLWGQSIG
jgi:hypothetical protein